MGDIRNQVISIYDAVADHSLWPTVLDDIARKIDARGCMIFEWRGLGPERSLHAPHFSSIYNREVVETYIDKCFEFEARDQDIFEAHSLVQDGIDLVDDSVLAETKEELLEFPNVKILQKFGMLHRAAGLLNKDNVMQSRFSVQLGDARGRLNSEERKLLGELLPHIAKALELGRPALQLASEHQSLLSAMDTLTIGMCIDLRPVSSSIFG